MLYEHETRTIFHGGLGTVVDFRCPSVETNVALDEFVPDVAFLCIPRRGAFHMHSGGGEPVFGDPNHVLFFNRGKPFRISYPLPDGDDSTFFTVDRKLLREILERYDPAAADDDEVTFPYESGLSDSRTFLLHRLLFERWSEGILDDPVVAEEGTIELVSRAVASSYAARGRARTAERPATRLAHRECAEGVKSFLAEHYHENLTLEDIARRVFASPYHLARVFKKEVGVPVHRYLNRLRLRASLLRIADSRNGLTDLALDLGYSSHSHFSDAFRREFGIPPSDVRRTGSVKRLIDTYGPAH